MSGKKNKINKTNNLPGMGKIPPSDIELEQVVLGAMLIEKDCVHTAMSMIIHTDVFYSPKHQLIFNAMQQLWGNFEPIDILTVKKKLSEMGELENCGGAFYLTELTVRVNSAENLETHIRIIFELWIKRLLIHVGISYQSLGFDDTVDCFQLLEKAQLHLNKIHDVLQLKKAQSTKSLYKDVMQEIAAARHANGITGVPSGLKFLDRLTGGWQDSDLIIVAGRPGMGKTTFVLNAARNAALDHDCNGLFFSLEMSNKQLMRKLIAAETEDYTTSQLAKGIVSEKDLLIIQDKSQLLYTDKIFIDDSARSISQIKAKAVMLHRKNNIRWIIVDYLQLVDSDGDHGTREQEISYISRNLKLLAKELGIPVIALSQLSRSVETRGGDKRPKLSDLRESGAIEQDADMVIFFYRREYYGITEDELGQSTAGVGELIVEKHRNGACRTVYVRTKMSKSKITDFAPAEYWYNKNNDYSSTGEVTVESTGITGVDEDKAPF